MFELGRINEQQKEAILNTEGPMLIIAGPGTGKTLTLVKRIAYLVAEKQVSPEKIMVVTFTEKAAKELITRISNEFFDNDIEVNINEMYIGTFHSVALRLLKENSEHIDAGSSNRVLDAFEQTYLICRNLEQFSVFPDYRKHIKMANEWKQALEICRYVNQMMEEMVDVESLLNDDDPDAKFLGKIVNRYKELLERNNAIDFSMIQTKAYEMLQNEELLEKITSQIKYIMVDEYQDTNYIQEQLVFRLAGERKNICVVGDDDQGMYRFRGATIRNILEFPNKFKDGECKTINLDKNYRSKPNIINFYNEWMDKVEGLNLFNWDCYRYSKHIVAAGDQKDNQKEFVYSCGGDSLEKEKTDLYKLVKKLKENNNISDYNQVVFLFRSVKSKEAKEISDYFEGNGIPIYSPRSEMFFEREEVKQMIGCIMLCFKDYTNQFMAKSFSSYVPEKLYEYYGQCLKDASAILKDNKGLYEYISKKQEEISDISEEMEFGLLDLFYEMISFDPFKSYLDVSLNENITKTRQARNISEISRMLAKFNRLHNMHGLSNKNKYAMPLELFNTYFNYMYIEGVGEYEDNSEYAPSGCISFMTIHQSKGLEFPVVVVGSLGNYPTRNSDPLLMLAENRFFKREPFEPLADIKYFDFWRLYYVAFSRAQNLLVLSSKKENDKYFGKYLDNLPSIDTFDDQEKYQDVKTINYKNIYSFTSHIALYDGCPMQYKFYKEFAFAQNRMFHTSVGSLVHATLEDINKYVKHENTNEIDEESIREWFNLNYESMQESTGYYLTPEQQEDALRQIINYYNHRKEELHKVWKAEEKINLILPKYILQGIIDLIEMEDNTVEIVDYKTGNKPDVSKGYKKVEHYKKQLEIYAYLVEKNFNKKVSKMHLYYTNTEGEDPLISFEWNRKQIDTTIQEVSETVEKIERKDFEHGVQNSYACDYCDMRYFCQKGSINE